MNLTNDPLGCQYWTACDVRVLITAVNIGDKPEKQDQQTTSAQQHPRDELKRENRTSRESSEEGCSNESWWSSGKRDPKGRFTRKATKSRMNAKYQRVE
jgi:hypothetical protein